MIGLMAFVHAKRLERYGYEREYYPTLSAKYRRHLKRAKLTDKDKYILHQHHLLRIRAADGIV